MKKGKHYIFFRRLPGVLMWGGLEKIMMDWFEHIDFNSCRVTLGISSGGRELFAARLREKKLPVDIVEFPFDPNDGSIRLFAGMHRFLKGLKPTSVIFIQGAHTDFRSAAVAAAFLSSGNNVYMHENLGVNPPYAQSREKQGRPDIRLFMQKLVNIPRSLLSRRIVVVSHEIKGQLKEYWGYPEQKIDVVYNGINLERFRPSQGPGQNIRRGLNIPSEDYVFIVTARLAPEKRIDRAIEAFDHLSGKHKQARLLIVGDGNLRNDLQKLARDKPSCDRILFLGHQENIEQYLNASDCYVNTSDTEGLCMALVEAMACGLCCVATDCTGPTEIIQNSRAGFLVDKKAQDICEGMQKAISLSIQERQALSQREIEFITRNFEVDRQVKATLDTMRVPYQSKGVH